MDLKKLSFFSYAFLFFVLSLSLRHSVYASEPTTSTDSLCPSVKVHLSSYATNKKSQRALFTTDFIVPLYYPKSKDSLFFFNPKYTYATPRANEINQGFGLRHIFEESFILGLNVFFDRRISHANKWYSQVGLGLEYLSHPLDIRLNWYKPLTHSKVVDSSYEFGPTNLQHWEDKEEPLPGFDFELGLPVFEKYTKTRAYFGGFFYQSKLAKDVNGFRFRTETRVTNWLSLDTTLNSKASGKVEFMGGVRLSLPFEWTNLFKAEQKTKSKPLPPCSTNTYLENRIFDRVVRDLDIQSLSSKKTENVSGMETIFVDNSNTTGTEDGTRDHPYTTLADALNDSRYVGNGGTAKVIYINKGDGTAKGYTGNFTLADETILWGSGYDGGYKGISASGYPILDGDGSGTVITLGDSNTVMGSQIQSGRRGIYGSNVSATIKHNILTATSVSPEVYILSTDSSGIISVIISDNTFTTDAECAIYLPIFDSDGISATISGNTITYTSPAEFYGIYSYSTGNNSYLDATISGNVITNNNPTSASVTKGIYLYSTENSSVNATISGNTFTRCGDGMMLISYSAGNTTFIISENIITGSTLGSGGIYLGLRGSSATDSVSISNNAISDNISEGIQVWSQGTEKMSLTVTENTLTENYYVGLSINAGDSGNVSAVVSGNTLLDNGRGLLRDSDGIMFNADTGSTVSASLFQNTVSGSRNIGVGIGDCYATGTFTVDMGGGELGSIGQNSIYDSVTYDVYNKVSGLNVPAQFNWWGTASPQETQFNGTVDYTNCLTSDPN